MCHAAFCDQRLSLSITFPRFLRLQPLSAPRSVTGPVARGAWRTGGPHRPLTGVRAASALGPHGVFLKNKNALRTTGSGRKPWRRP